MIEGRHARRKSVAARSAVRAASGAPCRGFPSLNCISSPSRAGAGEELRAQAERYRAEARARYLAQLSQQLSESDAAIALDALTVWNDVTSGDRCACSCHPRLADGDLHDYGFGCRCRQTPDDRRRQLDGWIAEKDAYWASPEGERITAARHAEEGELGAWLALQPDVAVRSHGGMFPEQWWGEVDDRSFYFRERNDHWRIELDLRPTGRFSRVWLGGDFDDPASFEPRSIDAGDVIAEGDDRRGRLREDTSEPAALHRRRDSHPCSPPDLHGPRR